MLWGHDNNIIITLYNTLLPVSSFSSPLCSNGGSSHFHLTNLLWSLLNTGCGGGERGEEVVCCISVPPCECEMPILSVQPCLIFMTRPGCQGSPGLARSPALGGPGRPQLRRVSCSNWLVNTVKSPNITMSSACQLEGNTSFIRSTRAASADLWEILQW